MSQSQSATILSDPKSHGWVRATKAEDEVLQHIGRAGAGRPKKDPEEVKQVYSLRLTPSEMKSIRENALRHGYKNWSDYVRERLTSPD